MSLWKKQAMVLAALAATATMPVMAQDAVKVAPQAAVSQSVQKAPVQSLKLNAHALSPSMLMKNDAKLASNHKLTFKGKTMVVNNDQLAAFNALPDDVKLKLGPPQNGQALVPEVLKEIKATSTVMCPW